MNILYDSSSLLALYVENHPHNVQTVQIYQEQQGLDHAFYMSAHSIAELYSNLTNDRVSYFDYTAVQAYELIDGITTNFFKVVNLKKNGYISTLRELKKKGLKRGIVYDGIISRAANKINADQLVTINEKHFKRLNFIHHCELINPLNF